MGGIQRLEGDVTGKAPFRCMVCSYEWSEVDGRIREAVVMVGNPKGHWVPVDEVVGCPFCDGDPESVNRNIFRASNHWRWIPDKAGNEVV